MKGVASSDNRLHFGVKCNLINYANNPIFMRRKVAEAASALYIDVVYRETAATVITNF